MAGFAEYDTYDAVGLAELVRSGAVTPGELLTAALDRAAAVNPALNAIVHRFDDFAASAVDALAAAGPPDRPLAGVPFLLKDLGALIAGLPLTMGSRLYADYIPADTGEIVERYRRAGLVIFGRTNSPEFGLSYTTEPALHGPTRNPWNTAHTPGGSSGGAAAAVAAGIVPAAHASDGGGSIRVPASCCGLFGLKPTRGRTPAGGEGWAGMAINHAVSRSVRDSATLLDAVAGPDLGDPYWAPPAIRPFIDEVGADPGRLRIAVSAETPNGVPVHPDCIAAMNHAATLCADLGHHIEEATPAFDRDALDQAKFQVIAASTLAEITARATELGRAPAPDDVEPVTWGAAELGKSVTGANYADAVNTLHATGRDVARFFLDYDVLLTPTMAQPPLAIGVLDPMRRDVDACFDEMTQFAGFPPLSNVTGAPAMSVPLFWTAAGLPIGAQFVGRFGDEATLLRLAAQLEQAQPWSARRPPPP